MWFLPCLRRVGIKFGHHQDGILYLLDHRREPVSLDSSDAEVQKQYETLLQDRPAALRVGHTAHKHFTLNRRIVIGNFDSLQLS
jgi:hypothetical protein